MSLYRHNVGKVDCGERYDGYKESEFDKYMRTSVALACCCKHVCKYWNTVTLTSKIVVSSFPYIYVYGIYDQ